MVRALGKRHGAGVKPYIEHLRHPPRIAAALFAFEFYFINVRAVEIGGLVVASARRARGNLFLRLLRSARKDSKI